MGQFNPDYKKFLKNMAVLLFVLFILDLSIGRILRHFFFREKLNKITYIFNKTNADILVFGSSRAQHHYVPDVFEHKFGLSFYNCGSDGCNMIYHLASISAVLERYRPKGIILEIDPEEFSLSEESKLSNLLPYNNNPGVHRFIKYNSKFEEWKLLSEIYPYNSLIGDIFIGNISSHKAGFGDDVNGFSGFAATMSYQPLIAFKPHKIIPTRIEILNDFLSELNHNHIPILLVISPIYYSFKQHDPVASILSTFTLKYSNVKFINYENNPEFVNYNLFMDEYHLNRRGAYKFSNDLVTKFALGKKAD